MEEEEQRDVERGGEERSKMREKIEIEKEEEGMEGKRKNIHCNPSKLILDKSLN